MVVKQRDIYLYVFLLFVFSLILNTINNILTHNSEMLISHIVMNGVLGSIFIVLYKVNPTKINIELVIGLILILWSLMCITIYSVSLLDYILMIVYGTMLLIKNNKDNIKVRIVIYSIVGLMCMLSFIFTDTLIIDVFKNLMLMSIMVLVHYNIYYNSYKEKPDIKAKYKLTDQEYKLINIFLDLCQTDPSNKAIAEKMFISESHIKTLFNSIYDKFDIKKGGNKKTVLIFKLKGF